MKQLTIIYVYNARIYMLHMCTLYIYVHIYIFRSYPSTSGPSPPSPSSWRLLSLCARNLRGLLKNVTIENSNYRIIDFPYRSCGFLTYRIIDLSIIEQAYSQKLSIHRYRSRKLIYRTNDYRFTKK